MDAVETIGSVMLAYGRDDVGVFDRDFVLARLNRLPEFVIDDTQFRDLGSDPLLWGIEARNTLPSGRVLHIALPVPDEPADVEHVVEDTGSALGMAAQRRVVPQLALRAGNALVVEFAGNGARRDATSEIAEDPAYDFGLALDDLAVAANRLAIGGYLFRGLIAVAESASGLAGLDTTT